MTNKDMDTDCLADRHTHTDRQIDRRRNLVERIWLTCVETLLLKSKIS